MPDSDRNSGGDRGLMTGMTDADIPRKNHYTSSGGPGVLRILQGRQKGVCDKRNNVERKICDWSKNTSYLK